MIFQIVANFNTVFLLVLFCFVQVERVNKFNISVFFWEREKKQQQLLLSRQSSC